ncbi:MAG: amidohydrolase family protein, partial [Woeseia sp.]|nr:amidohydrolase family protein [Woeseia sp.]
MRQAILALFTTLLYCSTAMADTLIHAGRLIDGDSDRATMAQTIRVVDGLIASIEDGYSNPANGDAVVDLRESTVLPGLMDTHVHLTGQ